ncbi:MAG TPA: AbrB/MazE/SpoVT family DNA-binding domain-containing protein [Anaerolineae bacterium]|nr:AbrB/MazE/SpoVT family DNA-binding domain-containing protein [Anaerolineae bacterium]
MAEALTPVKLHTRLVPIGNSRGVRIPKPLLTQLHLEDEVTLEVVDGALVVRPATQPRAGWEAAAAQLAARGEDALLDPETPTVWDAESWEW